MRKVKNAQENIRTTLEESAESIKKAAKEAEAAAVKTVEDVKDKVAEITETTEKKARAVKKTVKSVSAKSASKAAAKPAKAAQKKKKAAFAKSLKEKLTFEFNGAKAEYADIMKRVEKDALSKCGDATIKKLDVYFNANENTAYYVVNDEAKPEYKVVF